MNKAKKLYFELLPDGCWHSNLRTILSKKQWDYIKAEAKERANCKCMICGKSTNRLEAHEKWSYDEKSCTQILEDVLSICHDCHSVIHYGRTSLKGDAVKAEEHYMKVNNCSYVEFRSDLGKANEVHVRLNKVSEWKLNLSWLKRFIDD